jgi:hypothetical protein
VTSSDFPLTYWQEDVPNMLKKLTDEGEFTICIFMNKIGLKIESEEFKAI